MRGVSVTHVDSLSDGFTQPIVVEHACEGVQHRFWVDLQVTQTDAHVDHRVVGEHIATPYAQFVQFTIVLFVLTIK